MTIFNICFITAFTEQKAIPVTKIFTDGCSVAHKKMNLSTILIV